MNVTHLRCEYFENPLGIDAHRPRLSWQLISDQQGARQSAYQILADSCPLQEAASGIEGKVAHKNA